MCVGRKFDSIEWRVIRITDEPIATIDETEELPVGEIGELIVRGPQVSPTLCYAGRSKRAVEDRRSRRVLASHGRRRVRRRIGPLLVLRTEVATGRNGHRAAIHGMRGGNLQHASGGATVSIWSASVSEVIKRRLSLWNAHRLGATAMQLSCIGWRRHINKRRRLMNSWFVNWSLPVDVRHNAKINREQLAAWASKRLASANATQSVADAAFPRGAWERGVTDARTGDGRRRVLGRLYRRGALARGDRVRSFGRGDYPQLRARGVEVVRGDIRDSAAFAAACAGIECVFHCAALPGIGMDRDVYESINQHGTELLLANARRQGVKRFVYTSSPSVVFAGEDQSGVDESAPYDFGWMEANRAYYSYTKACAEQAVLAANGDEMRTCALRPHLIWGPGDTHLVPRLLARARSGRLRRIGDGANLVDVTYVENAADAHLQAADALDGEPTARPQPAGKVYFISQGEPVNCWQWIDEVLSLAALAAGREIDVVTFGRGDWAARMEAAYRLLRLSGEPPMTRFLAAQLSTSHWFDISAARRDLGYEPRVSTGGGDAAIG